jgi:hypothetical protein
MTSENNAERRYLSGQVETFKKQQLAESGHTGGADFWLTNGESANVAGAHKSVGFDLDCSRFRNFCYAELDTDKEKLTCGEFL